MPWGRPGSGEKAHGRPVGRGTRLGSEPAILCFTRDHSLTVVAPIGARPVRRDTGMPRRRWAAAAVGRDTMWPRKPDRPGGPSHAKLDRWYTITQWLGCLCGWR